MELVVLNHNYRVKGWEMSQNKSWLTSSILLIFDTLAIYAIFRVATIIRIALSPWLERPAFDWAASVSLAQLGLLFMLGMFFLQGLYPGYGLTTVKELEQMSKSILFAFFLLASVSYLNKSFQVFPRSILLISWGLSTISLPLLHFFLRNLLSRAAWYGMPVIVFGEEKWGQEVATSLKRVRRLGWKPQKLSAFAEIEDFENKKNRAQMAILAPASQRPVEDYARLLNQHFRKVVLVRKTDNFGSLWVEPRDLDGYLGLEFHYHLLTRRNRWMKRGIDIAGSALLLVLLSPLLAFLSLLILLDSPGSVFFRQERLGRKFQRFRVMKFRTMVVGAEEKLAQLLAEDPAAKAQYEEFHKLENDPRVTKLGDFLRKFSLDELPQLWNVLIGEMSLSGPRAYMPAELDEMGSYAPIILRVAPGMTGWWQVLGRHNTTFEKRLVMDEYYISNWSLWMDIYIFLKTFFVVLSGNGA
jgi:Undecaprenyl-phosphate galactose phosphotransferase WbaP